jgi:ABC-type lipoprotein release transport system permease subunit
MIVIGVIVGCLLTWKFNTDVIEIERIVIKKETIEVAPILNCKVVTLVHTLKKGDQLTKLIRPYSELKAAYTACLNSIKT